MMTEIEGSHRIGLMKDLGPARVAVCVAASLALLVMLGIRGQS
jgi:hypothetical protein